MTHFDKLTSDISFSASAPVKSFPSKLASSINAYTAAVPAAQAADRDMSAAD